MSNKVDQPFENLLWEVEAAWNRGDVHAYTAFYTKDAGYVSRAGMLLNGRTEIEKLHAKAFVESLRNTKLALKARRIASLTSATAVIYADVELKHTGNDRDLTRAITTFVVARVDEGWRVCAAHTTELAQICTD